MLKQASWITQDYPYGEPLILPEGLGKQGSNAIHQPCLSGSTSKVTQCLTYSWNTPFPSLRKRSPRGNGIFLSRWHSLSWSGKELSEDRRRNLSMKERRWLNALCISKKCLPEWWILSLSKIILLKCSAKVFPKERKFTVKWLLNR